MLVAHSPLYCVKGFVSGTLLTPLLQRDPRYRRLAVSFKTLASSFTPRMIPIRSSGLSVLEDAASDVETDS